MIVHSKRVAVLMRARHHVEELTPPGWQHEQVCFVCKALFKIVETYKNQHAPKFSKGKME
jgi:hypothetical protein